MFINVCLHVCICIYIDLYIYIHIYNIISTRLYSLHCVIHTHHTHILVHSHTPLPNTNLQPPNPTQPYKHTTQPLTTQPHAYLTYIPFPYKPSKS